MLKNIIEELNKNKSVIIKLKINPNSAKTEFREVLRDGTIKINVSAQPEKGKANKELIKYLAKILEIGKDNIKIISGETERHKLLKITI